MFNKKISVFALLFTVLLAVNFASAATLFSDNFASDPLTNGWSADCFGNCTGVPSSDVGSKSDSSNFDGTAHAWVKDDTALYRSISTSEYENINVSYCRRIDAGLGDVLRTGWKSGSYSNNWANWNQLEVYTNTSWNCVSFILPAGAENTSIYFAFFLDDGNNDNALLENFIISADPVNQQCTPNIQNTSFSAWQNQSACLQNNTQFQNRSLTQFDVNNCGGANITFSETQSVACTFNVQCVQNWAIGNWSTCVNGTQTRSVTDLNQCENATGMPSTQQACIVPFAGNLPSCSIDYLANPDGSFVFNISDVYFNQVGAFDVHGSAQTNNDSCFLNHVGYNRTSPNKIYYSWRNADNMGLWADWRTSQDDLVYPFVEGNHTVCCKVESRTCSGPGCDVYTNTNCSTFCIDTQDPYMTSLSDNTTDCSNDGKYTDSSSITWSWSAQDVGCSNVKEYNVTLKYLNGTIVTSVITSNTSITFEGLLDNQAYYVMVTPVDNAGNVGGTISSDTILVDLTNPFVDITSPTSGWFGADFIVSEIDTDTNLVNCSYKINNGSWVSLPCGSNFTVDVNAFCNDGELCIANVYKMATDKVCRVGNDQELYLIDLQKPNTTKVVGEPKVDAAWYQDLASWVSVLVNGFFVTAETSIGMSSTDGDGSGVAGIYYNITLPNGTVIGPTLYVDAFNLPDVDGLYNITYWAVDNVGNIENLKYEIDKVDNIAPNTNKTYGLSVFGWREMPTFNDLLVWMRFIRPDTNISLFANDSEVGVDMTYYQILIPSAEGFHTEWYGNTTKYWYESLEACVEAGNAENKCISGNWDYSEVYMNSEACASPEQEMDGQWCVYQNNITVEESDHKICYYSVDRLGNTEQVKCQVFSVDGIGPNTYIINPDAEYAEGNLGTACLMPLDVKISDEKVGVNHAQGNVYATINDSEGQVWIGNLTYAYNLPDGQEGWYYPNSVDLTGLPAGEYTLAIYAKDLLGNVNEVETQQFVLQSGVFIPANWINGCNLGQDGGICTLEFTACVRGVTDINFSMTKLMDQDGQAAIELASILQLNPQLITDDDQGMVGYLNQNGWPGEVVQLNSSLGCNEVINDRVQFNVTLNISEDLIDNIGTGSYHFDYGIDSFVQTENCD